MRIADKNVTRAVWLLSDAKYLIDLIYSHGNCELEEVENDTEV